MKIVKVIICFWLSISALGSFSQNQNNQWYFGKNLHLDFGKKPISLVAKGGLDHHEGCASIAHPKTGELLFYTDGISVWDKNNRVMPNGYGLMGNISASHSAVISPFPGDTTKYLVFTSPFPSAMGIRYSIVDMSLNNGLGDVDTSRYSNGHSKKNYPLDGVFDAVDKIAVVKNLHSNDYWVSVQERNNGNVLVYPIDRWGVDTAGKRTTITFLRSLTDYGCMKFSPDGKKLAIAFGPQREIHLYDFDPGNGLLSSTWKTITFGEQGNAFLPYGIEFSPNSKYLYTSSYGVIQFNTELGSEQNISASGIMVSDSIYGTQAGQLQLGVDKRIYCAGGAGKYMAVIAKPNFYGSACDFVGNELKVPAQAKMRLGLPAFVPNQFSLNELAFSDVCIKDSARVTLVDTVGIDSVLYEFGDPASGLYNYDSRLIAAHGYQNTGRYQLKAIVWRGSQTDTIIDSLIVFDAPTVKLGSDTSMCWGDSIWIRTNNQPFTQIIWSSDSSAQHYLPIKAAGIYGVTVANKCGISTDQILIRKLHNQGLELGEDTTICNPLGLKLDVSDSGATYIWDDGSTLSKRNILNSGKYWVQMSSFCGVYSDTLNVTIGKKPVVNLGNDTVVCDTVFYSLIVNVPQGSYLWKNGDTVDQFIVWNTDTIWVTASNTCGTDSDTVFVKVERETPFDLTDDTVKCHHDWLDLVPSPLPPNRTWSDGSSGRNMRVTKPGKYWLTSKSACTTESDTIVITELPRNIPVIDYEDGIFESSKANQYLWYRNDNPILGAYTKTYRPDSTGVFFVVAWDQNECPEPSNKIKLTESGATGQRELSRRIDVSINPNPARYEIQVVLGSLTHPHVLSIYSMRGEEMYSSSLLENKKRVNLSNLSAGVYLLRITGPEIHTTQRLVISK